MCEFRFTPTAGVDGVHHGDGASAPDCVVRVRVKCYDDDCDEDIALVIVDRDTGEALTETIGLLCDSEEHSYDIPLKGNHDLQYRKIVLRFLCCGETRDGLEDNIWVRCSDPAYR